MVSSTAYQGSVGGCHGVARKRAFAARILGRPLRVASHKESALKCVAAHSNHQPRALPNHVCP